MFSNILVPVDLAPRHGRSLELAVELAAPAGGAIRILHVVEAITGLSEAEAGEFLQRLEAKAHEVLAGMAAGAERGGVRIQTEVVYGSRAREILRCADATGADLIVLTSHRFTPGVPEEGWSTLNYQLGILSPCTVLLVK